MFTHNSIKSIYDFRKQKNLTILLKIIFNVAGAVRISFVVAILAAPFDTTTPLCKGILYPTIIANIIMQSSLGLFLLWRLRIIERKSFDLWIGGFLFIGRILTHVSNAI
jgi:hypothetical protein